MSRPSSDFTKTQLRNMPVFNGSGLHTDIVAKGIEMASTQEAKQSGGVYLPYFETVVNEQDDADRVIRDWKERKAQEEASKPIWHHGMNSVKDVIAEAIEKAKIWPPGVKVNIYGEVLHLFADDDAAAIAERVIQDDRDRIEAYSKSPAGIAAAQAKAKEQESREERLMVHLEKLDAALTGGERALAKWAGQYSLYADAAVKHRNDKIDEILKKLKDAGYKANECINIPMEKSNGGRYVIGQLVASLENGRPPHPMLSCRATQYEEFFAPHPPPQRRPG